MPPEFQLPERSPRRVLSTDDRRRSPGWAFLRVLWQAPLLAVPFAVFFGTLSGATWPAYVRSYEIALVFTGIIWSLIAATESIAMPALKEAVPAVGASSVRQSLIYGLVGMTGSLLAAVVVNFTLQPGMMGSLIQAAVWVMFSLLFAILFTAIGLAWEYHKSSIDNARRERDLELARGIQRSFLPTSFPPSARFEVHAINVPSRAVSGDFYDVVAVADSLLLAIADVEGKSVPAALLTAMLQASLRTQTEMVPSVAEIVANVNTLVCRRADTVQQFATFFLARVRADGRLDYSNAGHNPPLVFRADGGVSALDRGGMMMGVLEDAAYEEGSIHLARGDRVVLYTDGITERANPEGEEYGSGRLAATVRSVPHDAGAEELTHRVLEAIEGFARGVDPEDDQTLMILRVYA